MTSWRDLYLLRRFCGRSPIGAAVSATWRLWRLHRQGAQP